MDARLWTSPDETIALLDAIDRTERVSERRAELLESCRQISDGRSKEIQDLVRDATELRKALLVYTFLPYFEFKASKSAEPINFGPDEARKALGRQCSWPGCSLAYIPGHQHLDALEVK